MSRYSTHRRHSGQSSSFNGTAPRTVSTPPSIAWWKSPAILGAGLLGIGILGTTLFIEFTTQRVTHVRADDRSDSGENYALQRQQHCQASSHNYKSGDTLINVPFADRAVVSRHLNIFNSLAVLGECQNTDRPIKSKQPGTSLMRLLERIQTTVKEQRAQHNLNPVVATILIDDAEPGKNQPTLDLNKVKTLVKDITSDRGAIAIMVHSEELHDQLEPLLSDERTRVCSFNDVNSCVDWAFETGRKL
jgi:hypothetical protein